MWQLHIPTPRLNPPANGSVSIIVGQRSCVSTAGEVPRTVCVLADFVPCGDPNVVEEQIECLERVLPFGIDVLGFAGDMCALRSLAAQLCELRQRELVEVVVDKEEGHRPVAYRMWGAPKTQVDIVEGEVEFMEVRFALHTHDRRFPFLISSSNTLVRVVDGESYAPLAEGTSSSLGSLQLVQTGAASSTLRIRVVMAPFFTSACGVYETLFRHLKAALAAGTTRLIELNAHHAHLSYCCRVKPGSSMSASTCDVMEDEWKEVLEMIEDATGETVSHSDLRGSEFLFQSNRKHDTTAAGSVKTLSAQYLFFLLSFFVLLIAVFVWIR